MTPALIDNYARYPVTFVEGEGLILRDADGAEYLDFLAGIAVCNLGHCHPDVVAAVRQQAGRLDHVSNLFTTEPMAELAERLGASCFGGKGRVLFGNSGAEANEAALKLARKRRRGGDILVARGGFHGRTYGALSATPQEAKQAPFAPLVPGFHASAPDDLPAAIRRGGERVAAVLVEPIQGESGVHPLPRTLLTDLRAACDETGALLIFDEVQTGVGRTGALWAHQGLGVEPDAMTVAKGLGNGMPIGALIAGPSCADVFAPGDHGSTFAGGPIVAAAALAVLGVVQAPGFLERVLDAGELLADALRHLPGVRSVRGHGLMLGAEIDADGPSVVRKALMTERLILNATGPSTLRLVPPLVVSDAQVVDATARLGRVLAAQSSQ